MDGDDSKLFRPVCRELNLPIQDPINVLATKKVRKEDSNTGRIIEYNTSNSSVVQLNPLPEFGKIVNFFTYRSLQFVVANKFEIHITHDGRLIHIPDISAASRMIIFFKDLEKYRPLVTADVGDSKQLWILNR